MDKDDEKRGEGRGVDWIGLEMDGWMIKMGWEGTDWDRMRWLNFIEF